MMQMTRRTVAVLLFVAAGVAGAQNTPNTDSGFYIDPKLLPQPSNEPIPKLNAPTPVPTFDGSKPVYALASAIGGQINYSAAAEQVGSNIDRTVRHTLRIPDTSVDAMVLRGLDRMIGKRFPNTDRLFMRLHPAQLDGVLPQERDRVAFERLTAEIQRWPER